MLGNSSPTPSLRPSPGNAPAGTVCVCPAVEGWVLFEHDKRWLEIKENHPNAWGWGFLIQGEE